MWGGPIKLKICSLPYSLLLDFKVTTLPYPTQLEVENEAYMYATPVMISNSGKDDFYPREHWQLSMVRFASVVMNMPASTVYLDVATRMS